MLSMKYIANESGTILDALHNMAPEASKTRLRSWLKEGRVALEGQPVDRPGHSVAKGQKITLSARPRPSELTILHQDRHLVAIDKPNGLLSVATHYQKDKKHYASGWTDARCAEEVDVPVAYVVQVREEVYGPIETEFDKLRTEFHEDFAGLMELVNEFQQKWDKRLQALERRS